MLNYTLQCLSIVSDTVLTVTSGSGSGPCVVLEICDGHMQGKDITPVLSGQVIFFEAPIIYSSINARVACMQHLLRECFLPSTNINRLPPLQAQFCRNTQILCLWLLFSSMFLYALHMREIIQYVILSWLSSLWSSDLIYQFRILLFSYCVVREYTMRRKVKSIALYA